MAKKIYERLAAISYSRPSGTEEEKRAGEYLFKEIEGIGFKPVFEEFSYTRKVPADAYLAAVTEDGREVPFYVTGVIDSLDTPEEGLEAEFYYLRSFDDVSLTRIKGKVVLIHDRLSKDEYRKLRAAGIAGYVTTSGTVRDTYENSDLETARFRDNLSDEGALPAFTIRLIDAARLLRLRPKKVKIRLKLVEETVTSRNIVVTVPGKKIPEEIVVAGAHYDSVPFSLGSWDNGAGAVQIVALLEHLKQNAPDRTVKAILFGSEETGLRGSRAYLEAHEDEAESIKLMLNVDVGGSILGKEIIFIGAVGETEGWVRAFLKETGYEAVTFAKLMSSDCANFNDYGIPSISIGEGAPRGGGYMHTRYDNMDLIDEDVLEKEAGFLAKLADRVANSVVIPIPKHIPENLRKDIIEYFGEKKSVISKKPYVPEPKPVPFHF